MRLFTIENTYKLFTHDTYDEDFSAYRPMGSTTYVPGKGHVTAAPVDIDSTYTAPDTRTTTEDGLAKAEQKVKIDRKYAKEFQDVLTKSGSFLQSLHGKTGSPTVDEVRAKLTELNPHQISQDILKGKEFTKAEIKKIKADLEAYKKIVGEAVEKHGGDDAKVKDAGKVLLEDDSDAIKGGAVDDALKAVTEGEEKAATTKPPANNNPPGNNSPGSNSPGSNSPGGNQQKPGGGSPLDKLKEMLGKGGEKSKEEKAKEEAEKAAKEAEEAKKKAEEEKRKAEEEAERLKKELEEEKKKQEEEEKKKEEEENKDDENKDDDKTDVDDVAAATDAMVNAVLVKFVAYNEKSVFETINAKVKESLELGPNDGNYTEEMYIKLYNERFVEMLKEDYPEIYEDYVAVVNELSAVQAINAYVILSVAIADNELFVSLREEVIEKMANMKFATQFDADTAFDAYFAEALADKDFDLYAEIVEEITGDLPDEVVTDENYETGHEDHDHDEDGDTDFTDSGDFDLSTFIALLIEEVDMSDNDIAVLQAVIELLGDDDSDTSGNVATGEAETSTDDYEEIDQPHVIYEPAPIFGDSGEITGWSYPEFNQDGEFSGYGDPVIFDDIDLGVPTNDLPEANPYDLDIPTNDLPEADEPGYGDGDIPFNDLPVQQPEFSGEVHNAFHNHIETQVKQLLPELHEKISMALDDAHGEIPVAEFKSHFTHTLQNHYGHVFDQIKSGYDGEMPGDDMMAMMSYEAHDVVDQGGVESNLDSLLGTTSEAAGVVHQVGQQSVEITIEMAENIDMEQVVNHDIV